jgi:cyclic-di-GMP phosphodiesterase TipF (flagellum assembly factor)
MVLRVKGRRVPAGGSGVVAAAGLVLAAGGGAAALAVTGGVPPEVAALQGLACAGLGAAWLQGRRAVQAAGKASSDLDAVAKRLIELEHRVLSAAASRPGDPGLRTTVDEVSGEIGLLGGIVRDLAETVAAQDRDVADLKDQLSRSVARTSPQASAPRAAAEQARPVPQALPPAAHPEPSLLPIPRREPAISDDEARRMAAIVQAFEADRLELHLQPIVTLPQRKVRSYEALARLRLADETILVPAEFLPLLERLGHAAEFDRRVIGRGIAIARHLMSRGSEAIISVNLSPRSLDEPGFLRSVSRILDACPDTVGRIVFEISQRCWRTLDAERAGALAALRDRGVPFALDRASDLRLDPLALADRGVRFVKLPADLMLAAERNRGLDIEVGDLASVLRRAGIRLVAEKVEQEETVPDLIDLDAPLAQGFVFAAPRAVRAEVLAGVLAGVLAQPLSGDAPPSEAAPAAKRQGEEAAPAAPPPAGAPQERMSFRSFLRRAG